MKQQIPVRSSRSVGDNLQDHVYVPLGPLIHNETDAGLVNPADWKVNSILKSDTCSINSTELRFLYQ